MASTTRPGCRIRSSSPTTSRSATTASCGCSSSTTSRRLHGPSNEGHAGQEALAMPVTISDSLAGQRALVTGGTKGTGAAIVRRLAEAGATVMATARTMAGSYPDPGLFVAADITTPGGAQRVIHRVGERFGVLDILVHTAGGSHAGSGGFAALSDAQWQDELNLNLLAAVRLDRGLLPAMIEAGSGVIVHVSSIQRRMPLHEATLGYAPAKAP